MVGLRRDDDAAAVGAAAAALGNGFCAYARAGMRGKVEDFCAVIQILPFSGECDTGKFCTRALALKEPGPPEAEKQDSPL